MNYRHLEIDLDKNLFDQILISIAAEYGEEVARIARMARDRETFYFTIITESFLLIEVTLKMIESRHIFNGLPAFETEIQTF